MIRRFVMPAYRIWRNNPYLALPPLLAAFFYQLLTQPALIGMYGGMGGWLFLNALGVLPGLLAGLILCIWVLKIHGLTLVNRWWIGLVLSSSYALVLYFSLFKWQKTILDRSLLNIHSPPFAGVEPSLSQAIVCIALGCLVLLLFLMTPFCLVMFGQGLRLLDVVRHCRHRFFYLVWVGIQAILVGFLVGLPLALIGQILIMAISPLFPLLTTTLRTLLAGCMGAMEWLITITTAIRVIQDSKIKS